MIPAFAGNWDATALGSLALAVVAGAPHTYRKRDTARYG
jgi:hypothetical protein